MGLRAFPPPAVPLRAMSVRCITQRMVLARLVRVSSRAAVPASLFGIGAGGLLLHEHRARQQAERLAAATLETLLNAIDANDPVTGAHVRRVARYALVIGDAADLDEHALRALERIALFHDIGKIHEALFDIVHDDDKPSPADWRAISTHPTRGAEVLQPLAPFYPELPEGVIAHHECWDGSGYPRRLAGEDIPFASRIVALADTFDALTARRRYRPGRPPEQAADVICQGRGAQFDPELTDLFLCPPVFQCLRETLHREGQQQAERSRTGTRAATPERRRTNKPTPAPDVRFRWRNTAPSTAAATGEA
jgi:HD-GYP domain-containing protein (c-di-GMP phosphodiesterase class II)